MSVNIFSVVNTALGTLSPAVPFAMDELIDNLPDVYIVYSLISGAGNEWANNAEKARVYRVQVSILSRTGLASLPDVDSAMLAAGFMRGPERALPKDDTTKHYGLAKDYFYQAFDL